MSSLPSIFLSVSFLIAIVIASEEFQSNDRVLFMFTETKKNIHENYAFCSKFGMKIISISNEEDEKTVRRQMNPSIDWIWIEYSYLESGEKCGSKCCSLQMSTKYPKIRSVDCLSEGASMACMKVRLYQHLIDNYLIYLLCRTLERSRMTQLCIRTLKNQSNGLIS